METRIFGDEYLGPYNPGQVSRPVRAQKAHARSRPRRSRLEIRVDILKALKDGAQGPTQIMFKANLSWQIMTPDLRELVEQGILSEQRIRKRQTYSLTERGVDVLQSYLLVVEQLEQIEQDLGGPYRGRESATLISR